MAHDCGRFPVRLPLPRKRSRARRFSVSARTPTRHLPRLLLPAAVHRHAVGRGEEGFGRERGGGWMSGEGRRRRSRHRYERDGTMRAAIAVPGNSRTILTQVFGRSVEDDRYVLERFKALANRDIRRQPLNRQ